jgi:PKHD-type hydroxylase
MARNPPTRSWEDWIRSNLARGVSRRTLASRMTARGFSDPEVAAHFARAAGPEAQSAPVLENEADAAAGRTPHFVELPDLATATELDELERAAQAVPHSAGAILDGTGEGKVRRSQVAWLDLWTFAPPLARRWTDALLAANRDHFQFNVTEHLRNTQLSTYAVDAHYDFHMDAGAGRTRRRKLTSVLQLSDPDAYEGGALEIFATTRPRAMSRRRGTLLVFPAYVLHRVTPVTRGVRQSLTAWSLGPPFA